MGCARWLIDASDHHVLPSRNCLEDYPRYRSYTASHPMVHHERLPSRGCRITTPPPSATLFTALIWMAAQNPFRIKASFSEPKPATCNASSKAVDLVAPARDTG
jgi:hypothetical protein